MTSNFNPRLRRWLFRFSFIGQPTKDLRDITCMTSVAITKCVIRLSDFRQASRLT